MENGLRRASNWEEGRAGVSFSETPPQKKKVARRPWVVNDSLIKQTPCAYISISTQGHLFYSAGAQRRRAAGSKRGWIRRAVAAGTTVIFATLMQDICCKEESGRMTKAAKCHCGQDGCRLNSRANTLRSVACFYFDLFSFYFAFICFEYIFVFANVFKFCCKLLIFS